MRIICALVVISFIAACSHPLEIVGEGDIVSSTGENDCALEEHPCANHVTGDYKVTYTAVPRSGWEFSRWQGCDIQYPDCTFDVPGSVVDQFHGEVMPSLVAIFDQGLMQSVDEGLEQQAYLKASDAESGDEFGSVIDLSGNTLVVGVPDKDIMGTGTDLITGEPVEGVYGNNGAAYVLSRSSGNWVEQAYLTDTLASRSSCVIEGEYLDGRWPGEYVCTYAGNRFGASVAISGNTFVVGSPGANKNSSGVQPSSTGAVYEFTRKDGLWSQTAFLTGPTAESGGGFGGSLALSGDTLVVGAPGVGDYPWDTRGGGGAVYVFSRKNGVWRYTDYLRASNAEAGDWFGSSLALSGDTLVIGAPGESSSPSGGQSDNSEPGAGAAYIFNRGGDSWIQTAFLKGHVEVPLRALGNRFGHSVSIKDDTVAVGEPGADRSALREQVGAIYVFIKSGRVWSQEARITPPPTSSIQNFGSSIALSEDILWGGSTSFHDSGVIIFTRKAGAWNFTDYLEASNAEAYDGFGSSLAVSGSTVAVGAPRADGSANGDQSDDSVRDSGAVYVFE